MSELTLKAKRTKVNLEIDGQVIVLTRPSFREQMSFKNKLDNSADKESASLELIESFLSSCGLEKAIFDVLETDTITELIEALSGQKKS